MNSVFTGSCALLLASALLAGCERPPVQSVQGGYRGTGMVQVTNPRLAAARDAAQPLPAPIPAAADGGPAAKEAFKNVPVLGDLSVGEFTRTMLAITAWVSPKEGCAYCHAAGDDLSSDKLYTKVVARKMLQMTQHINADWKQHVAATGVTCYTCHRGQPVPAQVWFSDPGPKRAGGVSADHNGQNHPAALANLTSLPLDPLTPYLLRAEPIRVVSKTALPVSNPSGIKQAEWTYSLMTYVSQSLGVNCTYCHDSRSFTEWAQSPPARTVAFHGVALTRDLNKNYLEPLTASFPAARRGVAGDVAKVGCATCHQGVNKPLHGAPLLKDHPVLGGAIKPVAATGAEVMQAAPAAAAAATSLLGKVLFAVGKKDIGDEAARAVSAAAAALKAQPGVKAVLSGFADRTGDADKNLQLAKDRAFAVRDALKSAGVAEDRIVLRKPEFVIGTADADSRRVDINAAP